MTAFDPTTANFILEQAGGFKRLPAETYLQSKGFVAANVVSDWNGTTGTDNLAALQAALDTGKNVIIPPGSYGYKGILRPSVAYQTVFAAGAQFYWMGPTDNSGRVIAMLVALPTAVGGRWEGGHFDHRGANWTSAVAPPASANRALESAIVVMADYYEMTPQMVEGAFDNGIGLMRADMTTGVQVVGSPSYPKVFGGHGKNNGVGIRTHDTTIGPHQVGAFVNNLTASHALVVGCTDDSSRNGFIADYGGGASGVFIGCISNNATESTSGWVSLEGETIRPSGIAFYCGTAHVKFIGCQANDAQSWAVWFDGYSAFCDIDIAVKYCGRGGHLIQGKGHKVTPRVKDAAYRSTYNGGTAGPYPAIRLRGTSWSGSAFEDSNGIQVSQPYTDGNWHTYGLEILAGSGGQKVRGGSDGGVLSGQLAPIGNFQIDFFSASNFRAADTTGYVRSDILLKNAANDAAAAAAGVPLGSDYRNGSIRMTRVT